VPQQRTQNTGYFVFDGKRITSPATMNTPRPRWCSVCSSTASEQDAARALRRPLAGGGEPAQVQLELVRYATLAPSSHNTQCWTYHLQDQAIVIAPDPSRRCLVVDPDDHHLYVTLGCATENLTHAALAAGLQAEAGFDPAVWSYGASRCDDEARRPN